MNRDSLPESRLTDLLAACRQDPRRDEELILLVLPDLKAIAHRALLKRHGVTLQTTELVNEAWMKLFGRSEASWKDRLHFFAIASRAMQEVLVDRARVRLSQKRGGDWQRVTLGVVDAAESLAFDLLDLDEALEKLSRVGEREATIVKLRFFGGLEFQEIAELLEVSPSTIKRDWRFARAWLAARIGD